MRYLARFVFSFLLTLAIPAHAADWTIDSFLDSLARSEPQTIEEALNTLPAEVRSSFTLLYDGHGLRGTSYDRPGVILFSDRGEYAITFGDASHALGNEIEIARFVRDEARVELYKADFPLAPNASRKISLVRNPSECVRCHTADPKMLWGPYAKWPGIYGSEDDQGDTDEEGIHLAAFLKAMPTLERYRTLVLPKAETNIPPYNDDSPASPYTVKGKDRRWLLRPNLRLSSVVARVDGLRAARKLRESPTYARDRVTLLSGLLSCARSKGTEVRSTIERMGVSIDDFQSNILELPTPAGAYPYYYDGIADLPTDMDGGPTDEFYSAWGNDHARGTSNSIAAFALPPIYEDVIRAFPELPRFYQPFDLMGYDGDFTKYPSTRKIFADLGSIASFIYLPNAYYPNPHPKEDETNTAFCDALAKASPSVR